MASNRPRPPGLRNDGIRVRDRPSNLIPNATLNTATAIRDYLKANFSPACIRAGETLEAAHRRAGEVELAQRLIATIEYSQEHRGEETLED